MLVTELIDVIVFITIIIILYSLSASTNTASQSTVATSSSGRHTASIESEHTEHPDIDGSVVDQATLIAGNSEAETEQSHEPDTFKGRKVKEYPDSDQDETYVDSPGRNMEGFESNATYRSPATRSRGPRSGPSEDVPSSATTAADAASSPATLVASPTPR